MKRIFLPGHAGVTASHLVVVLLFLLAPSGLWAQVSTTSVRGVVTDPAGAVVGGAQVTLANPSAGFSRTVTTNERGEYQFLQIVPNTYSLSVTAAGFTSSRKDAVTLLVNTPATLNFSLQVGRAETVVEVHDEAPVVNTTDATLGNAFNSKQIQSLPSEGRNAVELLSLQTGVTYIGTVVDQGGDSRGGSVNGARSDQTNVTVDGLDNNDQLQGNAFSGVLRIPMDSLEEFRVTTTNSNADSGRSSGAQVSLVTKSGTNQFHGSAYEYNRSSIGTANDWFNRKNQLDAGLPNKPGQLIRNTFGAAFGGPVIKDRLFFFANYEGQRSREAVQVNQSVPSADLRRGIVSYRSCGQLVQNPDGSTTCVDRAVTTLQPSDIQSMDPNCMAGGTCPNGSGISQAVLDLWDGNATLPDGTPVPAYPLSNTSSSAFSDGLNILGYSFSAPQPQSLNTYLLKLDYNLTQNGNHRLFVRGNLQNDRTFYAPNFPGQPPSAISRDNSKGIAAGYSAVFSDSLINNFRYAFVRQGLSQAGLNPFSNVEFWNLTDQVSFQRSNDVNVPFHQIADDVTLTRGIHTLQFGGNWRLVFNNRFSNEQNFALGSSHPTWLAGGGVATTGQDLDPDAFGFPLMDPDFAASYDAAITDITGILGSISNTYNQTKSGVIPTGALVPRHFKANEAEFYVQDAWRATRNLQLTFGLRYSLLQPPYETSGNQVSPNPSFSSFFARRAAAMQRGETYSPADGFSFELSGQGNGGQPYWNWDYKNIAPRFAFAYSPTAKTSVRGGYGIYYDHFGQGVVNSFDREGSLGFTTYLVNPAGIYTTDCAVRFVGITTLPENNGCGGVPELPAPPPPNSFPYVPPRFDENGAFAIGWGIDDTMRTPYSHVFDFSITQELPRHFVIELAYAGRLGRRLLQEVDLAQPLNIRDPQSGTTYYQAATKLAKLANAGTDESSIQPIPYWENLFPDAAGAAGISGYAPGIPGNPSATQNIYDLYYGNVTNETFALQSLDTYCFPACSTLGPYAYWNDQFSSMYSWRTQGISSYNALQFTLRRHYGALEFDFNYTFSKSLDENSNAERVNEYEQGNGSASGSAVAYSGQVVNAWMPHQLYGPSDFDARHQINGNWVYDVPFGRGKRWGATSGRLSDAFLGGWQFSGLGRWTSGLPFSVSTYAFPTNYEQDSKAILVGAAPRTGAFVDGDGDPNVFAQGPSASDAFRYAYPGESGQRNNLRGPGYFDIDMSLAKTWKLSESQLIHFSWDVFNVTNSVRFDVGTLGNYLFYQPSLGKFTQTLTKPRVMQFGLRYSF